MYKVEVDYNFVSPSLQVVSGVIRIGQIDLGMLPKEAKDQEFTFKKQQGSLEYKNCCSLFGRTKSVADIMIRSYFDGMMLRDLGITWFRNAHRHNNDITITFMD